MAAQPVISGSSLQMASAPGTRQILDAIGSIAKDMNVVRETTAALKSDVDHMAADVRSLTTKVDRMDQDKATRGELQATEVRVEKSVGEVRAQAIFEAGRLSQLWSDKHKALINRLQSIEGKVDELERVRWKVMGAAAAIGALSGSAVFGAAKFFLR